MNEIVRVAAFEGWNPSIASIFGKSPKLTCLCGECYAKQSLRFNLNLDFNYRGRPTYYCDNCGKRNYVPIIKEVAE